MTIDLICLGFCLLYMIFGWFTGGLIQVLKIGALIVAYFASVWLEPVLVEILSEQVEVDPGALSWAALIGVWVVVYVTLALFVNTTITTLRKNSDTLSKADRFLGLFVGMLKALVAIVLLVLLFSLVKDRLYRHRPELSQVFRDSLVMATLGNTQAARYILPDELLNLARLAEAADTPEGRERLVSDPNFKRLRADPTFKELADDAEFQEAVREGRLSEVFGDPRVKRLLADPATRELLLKFGRGAGEKEDAPDAPDAKPAK